AYRGSDCLPVVGLDFSVQKHWYATLLLTACNAFCCLLYMYYLNPLICVYYYSNTASLSAGLGLPLAAPRSAPVTLTFTTRSARSHSLAPTPALVSKCALPTLCG